MKLQLNDVIKINQEVFDFLYKFQYGGTAFGSDYYIVTKITGKYYYLKEMCLKSGLRYTKKQIQLIPEDFHRMTEQYDNLVVVLSGEERLSALQSVLEGQLKFDNEETEDATVYLKELVAC